MSMSKKHYEMIARAINIEATDVENRTYTDIERDAAYSVLRHLATDFANNFWRDNPHFNRDKFRKACGV